MKKIYDKYEEFKEDLEKGIVEFNSYGLIELYNKILKMSDYEQLQTIKYFFTKEKEVLLKEKEVFKNTKLEGNFAEEKFDIGMKYYQRIFEIFDNRLRKIENLFELLKNDKKISLDIKNKYSVKDWEEVYDTDTSCTFNERCQSKRLNILYDSLFKNIYNAFLAGMYDALYDDREFDTIYVIFKTSGGRYKNYEFCTNIKNLKKNVKYDN